MISALFGSNLELLVHAGFVYLPLLFDAEVENELRDHQQRPAPPEPNGVGPAESLRYADGRWFVKSLALRSLVAGYHRIHPERYHELRRIHLPAGAAEPDPAVERLALSGKLKVIMLEILPHFVATAGRMRRKRLNENELLEWIRRRINIPDRFQRRADELLGPERLRRRWRELHALERPVPPPVDGLCRAEVLRTWFEAAVAAHMVSRERHLARQALSECERTGPGCGRQLALLLYLEEQGRFEVDGFGVEKIGAGGHYLIYKRTGPFELKDYYGRRYRFPDCRVAVPSGGPFRPLVLETYKHPFLPAQARKQEICLPGGYAYPNAFSAAAVIRLLEDGINALLYGYDPRRRNGYHSLDPVLQYVKDLEFVDYRV